MTDNQSGVEPASPPGDGGLVRLRLDLSYDGAGFSGWARQPGRRTVQGVLEDALWRVLRLTRRPQTTCAGRTDAGVHASAQVAHVDVPATTELAAEPALTRAIRGALPPDVRVRRARLAPAGFDARFSALSRRYVYRLSDDPAGVDPLRRRQVVWHRRLLDADAMNAAGRRLVGEHDFAAYCRRREGATTVRRLTALACERDQDGLVLLTVEADAFCHQMVRALVGALVAVGDGRRPVGWPAQVLQHAVRDSAVMVMPAHGLTLEAVTYPPDEALADRARETRRVRAESGPLAERTRAE